MTIETKIDQRGQTTIPAVYRKKFNIQPNDIVEWSEDDEGNIIVNFRKKVSINEMIGKMNWIARLIV